MPERIVTDPDDTTVARWITERDELLDRIEAEDIIPDWCWSRLTRVLAKIDEQPDWLAWLAVRFLQDVVNRGADVFDRDRIADQSTLFSDGDGRPTLVCPCGESTGPAVPARSAGGKLYMVGDCPDHGEVVAWERRPADDTPL